MTTSSQLSTVRATARPSGLVLRAGRPTDAAACGAICYHGFKTIAEKHAFPPDFPSVEAAQGLMGMLLGSNRAFSVVAEIDGRVVGSNFLWGPLPVGGVGPITIDPEAQNAGVGRSLMEAVLEHARGNQSQASELLGISRTTLRAKLQTLGLGVEKQVRAAETPPPAEPNAPVAENR